MKVGFTGSREGMTPRQKEAVRAWIHRQDVFLESHDGDCVGADFEFRQMVAEIYSDTKIVSHPCDLVGMRAHGSADEIHRPLPPLVRNKNIVNACDVLLACPSGPEKIRSGTWSTIRYARKRGTPVVIFEP